MRCPGRTAVGCLAAAWLLVGCAGAGARPAAAGDAPAADRAAAQGASPLERGGGPAADRDGRAVLSLAGEWRLRLDPDDQGVAEAWFAKDLPDRLRLPGSLQEQGFGNDVAVDTAWTGGINDRSYFTDAKYAPYREPGNVKVPFWLQPEKHYVGPAWYQRTVTVPEAWRGRRIVLFLERCHWTTAVWVDGKAAGSADSLSVPHEYDLTAHLAPGEHRLTVRVDNRMHVDVGRNAHSVSDHTQSNWNGITGRLELRAGPRVWIDDVQVFPDVAKKAARVQVTVGNATGRALAVYADAQASVFGKALPPQNDMKFSITGERKELDLCVLPLGDAARLWDEFSPALYGLTVSLRARPLDSVEGPVWRATAETTFGLREIATRGTQFVLNGRPIFLRGTLECCIFPLTGYPPTDVDAWKHIIRVCQAHGLNHMRFHSHCPPEAAFTAADELGFYFQVECAAWVNGGPTVGDGKPIDGWLYAEADRILRAYGNHPSFLLLACGNEPAGPGRGAKYLGPWVTHYKAKDARHLVTSAAGWPIIPENQYHVTPQPRIHHWGGGLGCRLNAKPPETETDYSDFVAKHDAPVIAHEIGQWCVYPNFDEIAKYTGVLKPKNFEIFRDFLAAAGMADQARDFLMASGRLQVLCYKEEVESALRTAGFGGFQLLDLHDFPGQGTALVGVLDPFWDSKPYVAPAEFRRFCGPTVPLARLPKRIFAAGETLRARIDVSHFGPADLAGAEVRWTLRDAAGKAVGSGALGPLALPTGRLTAVGDVACPLDGVAAPQKLVLTVSVPAADAENDWDVWVYPKQADAAAPAGVHVADRLDDAAVVRLRAGGAVVLLAPPDTVRTDVKIGFSSIFWNTSWTRGQPPHTLGILCDPGHPALAAFPTETHSNWQWSDLVRRGAAMVLDGLPADLRPIVQVVPDWFDPKRLGLAFEARVAGGRLLVCSVDLATGLADRPEARQMRHSLLAYAASKAFAPKHEATLDEVRALLKEPPLLQRLGATTSASSQQRGYEASLAIDGDPKTIWHTTWEPEAVGPPHHLTIDLGKVMPVLGLTYLPRQDMTNGRIATYEIVTSQDGTAWSDPVAAGTWPNTPAMKRVRFKAPVRARFVRLVARSEANGRAWASAAEVDVILE